MFKKFIKKLVSLLHNIFSAFNFDKGLAYLPNLQILAEDSRANKHICTRNFF